MRQCVGKTLAISSVSSYTFRQLFAMVDSSCSPSGFLIQRKMATCHASFWADVWRSWKIKGKISVQPNFASSMIIHAGNSRIIMAQDGVAVRSFVRTLIGLKPRSYERGIHMRTLISVLDHYLGGFSSVVIYRLQKMYVLLSPASFHKRRCLMKASDIANFWMTRGIGYFFLSYESCFLCHY